MLDRYKIKLFAEILMPSLIFPNLYHLMKFHCSRLNFEAVIRNVQLTTAIIAPQLDYIKVSWVKKLKLLIKFREGGVLGGLFRDLLYGGRGGAQR